MRERQERDHGDEGRQDAWQETIRIVREMKEEDLGREGMHAFLGKGKHARFIRWAYEHARLHDDNIQNALKKLLNCDRIFRYGVLS